MLAFAGAALLGLSPVAAHPAPASLTHCRARLASIGPAQVDADSLARLVASADGCWKVVNFWAGWCAPCRAEVPHLAALQADPRWRRLEIITVNMDRPQNWSVAHVLLVRARAFRTVNLQLVPPDFDDVRQITGGPWNLALPLTVVIGPDGKQRVRHDGAISISRLIDYLAQNGVQE